MTFMEKVDNLIEKRGMTRNSLAKEIDGLNHNSFNAWSTRGTVPSGEIIARIAQYFNVTTDYLLGRTNNPNPPEKEIAPPELSRDAIDADITNLLSQLPAEERRSILDFAGYLAQRRKATPREAPERLDK